MKQEREQEPCGKCGKPYTPQTFRLWCDTCTVEQQEQFEENMRKKYPPCCDLAKIVPCDNRNCARAYGCFRHGKQCYGDIYGDH